jgi:hypothetical protein
MYRACRSLEHLVVSFVKEEGGLGSSNTINSSDVQISNVQFSRHSKALITPRLSFSSRLSFLSSSKKSPQRIFPERALRRCPQWPNSNREKLPRRETLVDGDHSLAESPPYPSLEKIYNSTINLSPRLPPSISPNHMSENSNPSDAAMPPQSSNPQFESFKAGFTSPWNIS